MSKRKTVEEIHDIVLAVNQAILRDGQTVEKACKAQGIEVANYYRWRNKAAKASAANGGQQQKPKGSMFMPMNGEFQVDIVGREEAGLLLAKVTRLGMYSRFVPKIVETCSKLGEDQFAKFVVPTYAGKDKRGVGIGMMSAMNSSLRKAKIKQRIRFIESENVCVSEPYTWG